MRAQHSAAFTIALAGALALSVTSCAHPDEVTVRTDKGVVEGARKGAVRVFQGIPYAAPPVGALRFRAPEPHAEWRTPLQATRPGSSCPQAPSDDPAGRASTNEDCLYLNVWTRAAAGARRPVMVWIHGGGFTEGDGAARQYDGTHLVDFADVVLVTINYRVGPFGFLAAPALGRENARGISGNYGILDQQAALRWVRANIGGFGGDPGNVTLFGESAGAMSVAAQLASPLAAGLFQRAIVQSSANRSATPPLKDAEKSWEAVIAAVGCKDAKDEPGCLRAAPVDAFLKVPGRTPNAVTDGVVLPLSPPEAFRAGRFNKVPVMAGNTTKEFYLFAAREETRSKDKPLEWADLPAKLAHMPFDGSGAAPAEVLAKYPAGSYANAVSALATIRGDALFACTTDATLSALAAYVPAYGYQLDITGGFQQQPLPPGHHLLPAGVSYHTTDLAYVFNNRNDASPLSGRDLALAHMTQGYWTRFAATGDPNGAAGQKGPKWPRYGAGTPTLLSIRDTPALQTNFAEEHRCGIWNRPAEASNSPSK